MSATHFITLPTFHRKRIFQNQLYGELLTEALFRIRQAQGVLLHDYVVMPDHVHLLLTAYGSTEIPALVQALQRDFAKELSGQYGYSGEVWEPSFRNGEVRSAEACAECVKHIHSNPVRVGFCEKPGEYILSSRSSHWVLDPLPEVLRPALLPA